MKQQDTTSLYLPDSVDKLDKLKKLLTLLEGVEDQVRSVDVCLNITVHLDEDES